MWNAEDSFRTRAIWISAAVVVVGAAAAGIYYNYGGKHPLVTPPAVKAPPPQAEPGIQHPVPNVAAIPGEAATALPPLKQSDDAVHGSLVGLIGQTAVESFVNPESFVRHAVATIDNLTRKKVAVELRPVKPTPGQTVVVGSGDVTTLSPDNYTRYAPFVAVVKAADVKQVAAMYFRFYPLFQQAYEDLGYPGQYFNDRLVLVIDNLLATPQVHDPIKLVQPKVFYQFQDPSLEGLTAGQKVLIRMGSENATVVKGKLRALRDELVAERAAAKAPGVATPGVATPPAPDTN